MSKVNEAVECFGSGFNCSQAVLSTYCEDFGLGKETALKLSHGLGAGMGRLGHTCGAVSAAYLLLGLKQGSAVPGDTESKEKTYAIVQEFSKRFEERCGSTICRELLNGNFQTSDKQEMSAKVKTVCPKMVQTAAEILEEMLLC
jgi:C_GCAxxG_C_C family probable redox protein